MKTFTKSSSKNSPKNFYGIRIKAAMTLLAVTLNLGMEAGNVLAPDGVKNTGLQSSQVFFIENKGQVKDQYRQSRPDVLFSGSARGMVYHLRNNGISYQFARTKGSLNEIYRLDIDWLNINQQCKVNTDEVIPGFENFYVGATPVLNVMTYKGATYKNIYKGIDLHYYKKTEDLKYDFIVAPNADYKQIKLKVDGADKIELQPDGSLILTTPFGNISEGAPLVFQNGREIKARWVVKDNILSFDIYNYDASLPLLIDPLTRVWGTYYGGTGGFGATLTSSVRTDASGNVYMCGNTDAFSANSIATSGSHQSFSGGSFDMYLVKFNSAGVRQWATYYGDTGFESGAACSVDASGSIYLSGQTDSQSNITTPGSHQATYGGGASDCFLVKFNSSGVRQWATFFGGTASDGTSGNSAVDNSGNIYLVGFTKSTNGISTAGSHQAAYGGTSADNDGFLVKFNSSGVRQWATYYGGTGVESLIGACTDATGNIFISGSSASTSGISTTGSHQAAFGGGANDAFLAKFNSSGVRQWATYYGDAGADNGARCSVDNNGDVYMVGKTTSTSGISTTGSHQTAYGGGGTDAFLVKFNAAGTRQWCTYHGGSDDDGATACVTDLSSNILITGLTKSTSNIATTGAYQTVFGGGTQEDAMLVKFNSTGVIQWGTYYGGSDRDSGEDLSIDPSARIHMGGLTGTSGGTVIATPGSHLPNYVGGNDGFVVQFTDCNGPNSPANTTLPVNLSLCNVNSTTITATASGAINWFGSINSSTVLNTGGSFVTPVLTPGIHTYYAETTNTCSPSGRTAITITVNPLIVVNSGAICSGGTFTMVPTGVASYTFSNGNAIVSPLITTSYTVTGTDQGGCTGSVVSTVTVNPLPAVAMNSGTICSGAVFTLIPSGASTYTISGITPFVNPTVTSTYTVTGEDPNGCKNIATSTVVVNPSPIVTAVSSKTTLCKGQAAVLTASGASTYSWSNGAVTVSISVSPTITTSYTVTGTATNSCSKQSVITQTVKACTGISESPDLNSTTIIFPNPNNGNFNVISTIGFENGTLEIYNSLGQILAKEKIVAAGNKFDLSQYSKGIYFLKIVENNVLIGTSKIIKE